jgi:hypothetical protein
VLLLLLSLSFVEQGFKNPVGWFVDISYEMGLAHVARNCATEPSELNFNLRINDILTSNITLMSIVIIINAPCTVCIGSGPQGFCRLDY